MESNEKICRNCKRLESLWGDQYYFLCKKTPGKVTRTRPEFLACESYLEKSNDKVTKEKIDGYIKEARNEYSAGRLV